jgi:acyl-CoA reductase-like NAD-dependent aldehyde dehydrogenase
MEQDRLESRNPLTGEVVGSVPRTPVAEIAARVARGRQVQPGWAALGFEERKAILVKAAEKIRERVPEIARTITLEMGKPLREATFEVMGATQLAGELDEIGEALAPEVLSDERARSTIYRDPYGVAAVITPWNFPFSMPHWLILPALAAGNTVVFKPSEETPLTGQAYADAFSAVLPPDVLQVIHGADAQGKALVSAEVDLVCFTGSRDAGRSILTQAGPAFKRVILELGGKDPLIVLEDADLTAAAEFAVRNSFGNAGQVCVSTERIYVHENVAERFTAALAAGASALKLGDGLAVATQVGPMVNERQRSHVLAQIDEAVRAGARLVAGGGPHPDHFVQPTVLADVTHTMAIAREETFGPVACVTRVSGDEEAVRLANDSCYGLGAAVFGSEPHAEQVALRLRAGMVGINRGVGGARGTPWVGARESGYGFHKSRDGHRQFTQTRVLSKPAAATPPRA